MSIRPFDLLRRGHLLFLALTTSVVVVAPGVAGATNGARFTSLSAEYVELTRDRFGDTDGHTDDLEVTFTETGIGNSKTSDITVTATREVTVTCISAGRQYLVNSSDPLEYRFSDGESPDASAQFATDQNGYLTGTVLLYTELGVDICPRDPNGINDDAAVYLVKDYSLTYTDVTVTDNENSGATATIDRAQPGYTDPDVATISFSTPAFGFSCTIEDLDTGHCESH